MILAQRPKLVTAPAATLIDLTDAKAHCRVDHSDDDALIGGLITAATHRLDGYSGILGRCLINQVWSITLSGFPASRRIRLPFPDVSLAAVSYFDDDDASQELAAAVHLVEDAQSSFLLLDVDASWPSTADRPDAVTVEFTAGYGAAADDVPAPITLAAKLMLAHWYENREAVTIGDAPAELPLSAHMLLSPYRRVPV